MIAAKRKLIAAGSMVVLSLLMITAATFAWLTISTAPEISNMTTSFATNDNLEIALYDSTIVDDKPETADGSQSVSGHARNILWGNLIDFSTDDDAGQDMKDTKLKPVKAASETITMDSDQAFSAPRYGKDGRLDDFEPLLLSSPDNGTGVGYANTNNGQTNFLYFIDFYMRSNVGGNIQFAQDAMNRIEFESGGTSAGKGCTYTVTSTDLQSAPQLLRALRFAFAIKDTTDGSSIDTKYAKLDIAESETGSVSETKLVTCQYDGSDDGDHNLIPNSVANHIYKLRLYVYMDGTNLKNEDVAPLVGKTDLEGEMNLQFTIEGAELHAMDSIISD